MPYWPFQADLFRTSGERRRITEEKRLTHRGLSPPLTPEARPAAPEVNPFAWAQPYTNIDEYATGIQSQSAGGMVPPNPMAAMTTPISHPHGGRFGYVNPFNPQGAPIEKEEWNRLAAQMKIIHAPTAAQEVKAFEQNFLMQATGAGGRAPMPMEAFMANQLSASDDVIRNNPEMVRPEIAARYKEGSRQIRQRFADTMTRNQGRMTLNNIMDVGNNLSRDFPNHPGFIRDMIQSYINNRAGLRREYDQWMMERIMPEGEQGGSKLYRSLPENRQVDIQRWLNLADRGMLVPELAKHLGLSDEGGGLFTRIDPETGEYVSVTAEDAAKLAREVYGLEARPKEGEEPTPEPRIIGRVHSTEGKRLVLLEGGGVREETRLEWVETLIDRLRQRNKPGDREKIAQLEAERRKLRGISASRS